MRRLFSQCRCETYPTRTEFNFTVLGKQTGNGK